MKRHYRFEIVAYFHEPVGTPQRAYIRYGGVVYHSSIFPAPGEAYLLAMRYVSEQVREHYRITLDPADLDMKTFERIS